MLILTPGKSRKKRAVIVGAGPGGLSTAMLLAKAGLEVHVFEKEPHVGGRTSSIKKDGFTFDLGPTFFMFPQILREIFNDVGHSLESEVDLVKLDPHYRLVFGSGGELQAGPDLAALEREIAKLSPQDAANIRPYIDDNRRKLSAFTPILQRPFHSWRDLIDPSLARVLPLLRPHRSLDSDLSRFFKDPRVRLAFSFQSKYLGMSPFHCPSLFSILSFLEYEHGIFHPVGGCAALSQAMARVATNLGVHIHLNCPVQSIGFKGRRATSVTTPSGTHHADAFVINADFARAMTKLVPNHLRRRWTDSKIARKKFSCSTFMLYLGIDGTYNIPHHSIYIAADYEENLRQIEISKSIPTDPSFYVQNPAVTDPTLAPAGKSGLYVLAPVPHQSPGIDWSRDKAAFREKLLDHLPRLGVENVRDRIVSETVITPADWDSRHEIHLGATFNLAHTFRQMLHLRPRNRFEDLEGVYLVGGGTHPGSGLPVIFESARMSSRLVAQDLGLTPDWNSHPTPTGARHPSQDSPTLIPAA